MKNDWSQGGTFIDAPTLAVVMRCEPRVGKRAAYVLDSLLATAGVKAVFRQEPPAAGPWLLYAPTPVGRNPSCVAIACVAQNWQVFEGDAQVEQAHRVAGLDVVFEQRVAGFDGNDDVDFDLLANAFYFLSSWPERSRPISTGERLNHRDSVFARLGVAQDIVDRYLNHLTTRLEHAWARTGVRWPMPLWPGGASHAVVLSHDVDFIPGGKLDILHQGTKSVLRHLIRQRDPGDALRAMHGLASAAVGGRDPYGCVPELIEAETALGVRSSFQVAVARRHPNDVNYRIEDDQVRDYLRAIVDAGFDLCLHGSYRSSESIDWYVAEADLLAQRLARPRGSRQHYLSFDYDRLFAAQERAGIAYDMSMGFHDQIGPRAGFSFPYFPYCLAEDRPYNVLQISLVLMDVTLQSYLRLKSEAAWGVIEATLDDLRRKGGCASVVWHPIVFGGARDPGYDTLYWRLVHHIRQHGGLATDGRTIDAFWRQRCAGRASLPGLGISAEHATDALS